jgi:hypothetical protein
MAKITKNKRIIVGGIIGVIAVFLVIQLIPVSRTNPPVKTQIQWDSPQTEALVRQSCYDCHSNETVWPWYAYVAPVSWLVAHDVEEGRSRLNFSEQPANRIEVSELVENIQEGEMPPGQYLILHPGARLNDQEKSQLVAGIRASLTGG